jgi:hypothetical protein
LGVIDSLSKGFRTVGRRWWLITIPILLDLFLWLGPRASVAPIIREATDVLETEIVRGAPAEAGEWMDMLREVSDQLAEQYNLFSALRVRSLGIPSLLVWGGARFGLPSPYEVLWIYFLRMIDTPDLLVSVSDATFMPVHIWSIQSEGIWLLVNVLLSLVGILVGCAYLTLISHGLSQTQNPPSLWSHIARLGGRFLLFLVLRVAGLAALGIPFFLFVGALSLLSVNLAFFLGIVGMGTLTWLSFYGIFFIASLVMNSASVWKAIWNSFNVVMRNFWPTLWLFILINLIGGGLTILWQQLSKGSWLTLIGIVGNAYIGTSLVTASLIFYQDRYEKWRAAIANLLADGGRRAA